MENETYKIIIGKDKSIDGERINEIYRRILSYHDIYDKFINNRKDPSLIYKNKIKEILQYAPKHAYTKLPYYTQELSEVLQYLIDNKAYHIAIVGDAINLKKVNEIEGRKNHYFGDIYLEIIGEEISKNFREGEDLILSMFGGDEILILLKDKSKNLSYKEYYKIFIPRFRKINENIRKKLYYYLKEKGIEKPKFDIGIKWDIIPTDKIKSIEELRELAFSNQYLQ